MRFNKQELVTIASQTPQNFDREGILVLKERQDGFFRRAEGYSARWFRLRGNLLFYLRGSEQLSEPMGVVVLGRHQVKVQPQDENGHWPFQIVWDNGVCYRMATFLESERTLWLKAIQSAPYDVLKTQIATLKEKLSKVPPVLHISKWREQRGIVLDMNEIPLCELALSCDNLLCDSHGRPPSPMIAVNITFAKGLCVRYGNTEIVDTCSNPSFSKTILFRPCDGLNSDTLVKIIVYDVKEKVSETMVPMGYTSVPLSTIQEAQRLRIALTNYNKKTVGFITLNAWSLEPSYIGTSPTHCTDRNSVDIPQKVLCHRRSQSLPPRLGLKMKFPSVNTVMRQNFCLGEHATYRFHSGLGGDITVHEVCAEPRACFLVPTAMLDIFIKREKDLLHEMLSIGEMNGQWKSKQLGLVHCHIALLKHYWHAKRTLLSLPASVTFKQSCRKDEVGLEFAPVNLHLQRMWVHNDTLSRSGVHHAVTAGAFTAHRDARSGGLIRLVQQVKDINSTKAAFNSATASKIQADYDNIVLAKKLRDESAQIIDKMAAELEARTDISESLELLVGKTRSLMQLWNKSAVDEALSFVRWHKAKENGVVDGKTQPSTIQRLTEQLSKFEQLNADSESFDASSCSSKDASPCAEAPPLSASVPNISNNKTTTNVFKDGTIKEGDELQFHNDYFESGSEVVDRSRTSVQNRSFNRLDRHPKPEFKSSTSLELVSYKSLMNDAEPRNGQSPLPSPLPARAPAPAAAPCELEAALAAVVDAGQRCKGDADSSDAASALLSHCSTLLDRAQWLAARLGVSHATLRLRHEAPAWTRAAAELQLRRDCCFTQALTTAITGLVCWLSTTATDIIVKLLTSGLGPLCGFEGLLSLYLAEKTMWGDMVVAIEDLQTVLFTLVKSSQSPTGIPQVSGTRGAVIVHVPVSDSLYNKFTNKQHLSFTLTCVFFNMGINEKATAAAALGEDRPQHQSNCDNLGRLTTYYHHYRKTHPARASSPRCMPLEEVMEALRAAVTRKASRDPDVLLLAAAATRQMNGIRFTSCKSAKDRTAMSVTMEQSAILAEQYHLADTEIGKAKDILRSEGCRRDNTFKNIGVRKYAFTKRQVAALPADYRPPPGTYGSHHT
ncbi:inositol polyphosphate-4-phosphatase type I A-like [Plutella xylostella]|uniref:inositol polyphosphate-4-phosphatase type I A-like n=1 Tax=Plutella xylostella TaxID=51655 RepID=UPI002032AAA3|nr:inositol polyphosphate-4-phosphatase type I A-like [Plutella xylostella]